MEYKEIQIDRQNEESNHIILIPNNQEGKHINYQVIIILFFLNNMIFFIGKSFIHKIFGC